MKKLRIFSLVENTTPNNIYKTEHGLSLYIETNNHKILFDMGQTDLFITNAEKLGVDLSEVDIAILSHGHYDHGGGLENFLKINSKAVIYLSKFAFGDYYNGTEKYIGIDQKLKENKRFIFTDENVVIDSSLSLHSCNKAERKYNLGSFGLTELTGEKFIPDQFLHEQYLLIKENGQDVLISGCSHKGILDIVDWFSPDILVGGFHFSKIPVGDKLKELAEQLNKSETTFYTCHCTGTEQYDFMKKYIKKLNYLPCGSVIDNFQYRNIYIEKT